MSEIVFKKDATYNEIKEYIINNYGFKVSTLNIAQTKRKLGFDMNECYNLPSGTNKQPPCTLEKERAITDAFKWFGMI